MKRFLFHFSVLTGVYMVNITQPALTEIKKQLEHILEQGEKPIVRLSMGIG